MWIQDPFFLHSHARKINILALALVISPFLGPCLGAFMVNFVSWGWPYWIFSIEIGLILVAITLFVDETYYNRDPSQDGNHLGCLISADWLALSSGSLDGSAIRLLKLA
jgi:MFS family permease